MSDAGTRKLRGVFKLGRAVRFVWDGAPGWTALNVAVVLAQGVLPLATLFLFKRIVDAVSSALRHPSASASAASALAPGGTHRVIALALLLGAVAVATALLRSLGSVVSEAQARQVTDSMQALLQKRSVAADLEYYEDPRYYDTLHRAQQEAPIRPTRIVNNLVQIGQNAVLLAGIASLLLATVRWPFALMLVAVVVPSLLVRVASANRMHAWQRATTLAERRGRYYDWIITGAYAAKELRLFGIGPLFAERAAALRRELREGRLRLIGARAVGDAVTQTLAAAAVYGAFGALAVAAARGAVTLGALVLFFQAFVRGQAALQEMMTGVSELYENSLFLSGLHEFLDLAPKLTRPDAPVPVPRAPRRGIRFEQVGFHYAGARERPALRGIDLEIGAGEVVALVGENGSGKTTLVKLLCRLYDPTEGRITLDGTPLSAFDPDALRRAYGVVFQDYVQYSCSAGENIRLGDADLPERDPAVVLAAEKAGADRVIAGLPLGYDTPLGSAFDDGAQLSIGQWQKIALARAFVRDAPIVVLDEPSSALDATAEAEIFAAFRDLVRGRTAVLVSHRLSTVRMADRIVVLERGRIVEQGTHDALVRAGGAYARLFETQARGYAREAAL